jgi:dCTP deaminase
VSTYADPGFRGQLGVVLRNISPNYLKIRPGMSIAKIEFERLHAPVEQTYAGQHGYGTGIWPIARDMILSPSDARKDRRVGNLQDEARRAFGNDLAVAFDRVFGFGKWMAASVVAYVGLSVILLVYLQSHGKQLSFGFALVTGILTNLATTALFFMSTSIRRWIR